MGSLQAAENEGMENVVCPAPLSDPVIIELNRLHNQLKEKYQELGDAHAEIKALTHTQALKDKALQQLNHELRKLDDKLTTHENLLENKNLEITKLISEKKEAFAAQYAAEATLRRVYANQKDEDSVPLEAIIAPLEAEIKMHKNEIMTLREDRKALERATKSKESALLEAERILKTALERALIVEEVQNHNMELKRQIEICQEENRLLDKTNRQKVCEVEKLTQSIQELEESILASGAAANEARDYQRQLLELNEEKKIVERELARAKVLANRVAKVVSNEWKNDTDKVMPVKQWLEERKFFQAEVQRFKDKLAVSQRTAKAEAQLKEKFQLRLKTLEEVLKHESSFSRTSSAFHQSLQNEKSSPILGCLKNDGLKKRSTSQPRGSVCARKASPLRQPIAGDEAISAAGELKRVSNLKTKYISGETISRKNLWACRSKVLDRDGKENTDLKENSELNMSKTIESDMASSGEIRTRCIPDTNSQCKEHNSSEEDVVSGFLYDKLQREVINLLKYCEEKDATLSAKDEEIKMLMWKRDAVTKAMEIESRKLKRETIGIEKEAMLSKVDNVSKGKFKTANSPKRNCKAS